jgi:plastocyanin
MKNFLFCGLVLTVLFTISFSLISEPIFAQMNTHMSPRHQMQMNNDPSSVTCMQGMVLMMKNATGNPVCVSPTSYWRLADRTWGVFDTNLLNQNQNHMHGVMGAMINHPQMSQHMHDWMMNNPQHMQTMMDNWMPQMMQNNQWMMNMMGPIMNDPELNQQMMNHMIMNPQMMDTMKSNQQWMGMMHGQPMMGGGMYHGMMMNGTMNCPWCPFMQDSMNQSMMGMGCAWCQGHMGQGMMGSGMMNKEMMMGQQTQSSMQTGTTPSHGWMMNNPQHMQNMMNHMMNDPQMQQQMMNHMMNHPQMMQQWMQNQQYFDSQNGDVSDKTETSVNSQNAQVSIALGSASLGCEKTNECYLPYSITTSEHSSVTWTNDDSAVHTATSGIPSDGPNGIFDSGAISPGSTFTNQFDEEGTFDYYCIAHPWMTGNVVVIE